ncbi:hypothetical protein BOTBODRAFT_452910 [Botryobasidium botryosum FD-172 SS1]|uniref:C2H2-type domain-containing protein n=1 Tax=Botryobasidium botryosum (strain FD-172 SS1) TaxID=930990 RepID=A0A067M704_BOTB1|nr:hypothetical protein BOTBODRAFT_452910 [Botryobasidium botryosum FD-172 SS1]
MTLRFSLLAFVALFALPTSVAIGPDTTTDITEPTNLAGPDTTTAIPSSTVTTPPRSCPPHYAQPLLPLAPVQSPPMYLPFTPPTCGTTAFRGRRTTRRHYAVHYDDTPLRQACDDLVRTYRWL